MPIYNAERHLAEALASVLRQTHANFELIAIDDGSTDGTAQILTEFGSIDRRIRQIRQHNQGMAAALNFGLSLAHNDLVARMDADDRMIATRLERQLAFLAAHPETTVLSSLVYYIDQNGRRFGLSKEIVEPDEAMKAVSGGNLVGFSHPTVLMRKFAVAAVGGYRADFWPAEDVDLWTRLIEQGYRVRTQPEHLLEYRIHSASVSVTQTRQAHRKTGWVEACLRARLSGNREPDWEEHVAGLPKFPSYRWLRGARAELVNALFKRSVSLLSAGRPIQAGLILIAVAILGPSYVMAKVRNKMPTPRGSARRGGASLARRVR